MSSNEQAKASKEKTREIKVWVSKDIKSYGSADGLLYEVFHSQSREEDRLEATLLIREPEKTVTISETQFDEAIKKAFFESICEVEMRKFLKRELFGSET